MKQVVQFVLRCYQRVISPMLPHACRFVPTCSQYAIEAVEGHGVVRGGCWPPRGCRVAIPWGVRDSIPCRLRWGNQDTGPGLLRRQILAH